MVLKFRDRVVYDSTPNPLPHCGGILLVDLCSRDRTNLICFALCFFFVSFFVFVFRDSRKTSADTRDEKRIAKRLKAVADAARLPPGSVAGAETPREPLNGHDNGHGNGKILDIGCGDGPLMPHLLGAGEGAAAGKKSKAKAGKGGKKAKGERLQRVQGETSPAGIMPPQGFPMFFDWSPIFSYFVRVYTIFFLLFC